MDNVFSWKPEHLNPVIALLSVTIGFSAFWFITLSEKIKLKFLGANPQEKDWIKYVVFQKLIGALFMGVIPAVVILSYTDYSLARLGIRLGNYKESLIYILAMGFLIILVNSFAAKKPESLETYPQMRIYNWTKKRFLIDALAWGAYLFSYEFLFRGVLLILCYDSFGFWPAVAINVALYCCTHIPKGMGETIGAFPYGLLLCYVTIKTDSLAISFFTHWIMSISSDYFSIKYNPKMKFI